MNENLICYAEPVEFCERHKGNTLVRRCCHLGNRCVIESRIAGHQQGFIDYVEDLPDGDLICEPGLLLDRGGLDKAWLRAIERMKRGDAPVVER